MVQPAILETKIALSIIHDLLGANVGFTLDTVTVTTTSAVVIPRNPNRVTVNIINIGANAVWMAFDQTAIANTRGLVLVGNGGSMSLTVRDSSILPLLSIEGVTASSTSDVYVVTTFLQ